VAGRARRDIEEGAGAEFVNRPILHRRGCAAGKHAANMLDVAARGAYGGPYVIGPLPTALIGCAADGHASDVNDFEFAFFESAHFTGLFNTL